MNFMVLSVLLNSLFFALFLLLYLGCAANIALFDWLKFSFFAWFCFNTFVAIKRNGFFSVYALFLMLSAFFIYDCLFFDLIDYKSLDNFLHITFPARKTFSSETGLLFLYYSAVMIFVLDIFYYAILAGTATAQISYDEKFVTRNLHVVLFAVMVIVFPVICIRLLTIFNYSKKVGYINVVMFGIDESIFPSWTNGFLGIFFIAYLCFLIEPPEKRMFLIATILYGSSCFMKGISGNRGSFLYELFALIIIYLSLYSSKKVRIKFIVLLFVFCFAFSFIIGATRGGGKIKREDVMERNIVFDLLATQTTTRGLILTVIEYGDSIPYHNYPYLFQPIVKIIRGYDSSGTNKDERMRRIKNENSIDMTTAYALSPKNAGKGSGLGGAVIAEFIDCGKTVGILICTILLAFLIVKCDFIKSSKKYLRPILYCLTSNMMHNPRGYFFSFLPQIKYWIVSVIFYLLLRDLVIPFAFKPNLNGGKQIV